MSAHDKVGLALFFVLIGVAVLGFMKGFGIWPLGGDDRQGGPDGSSHSWSDHGGHHGGDGGHAGH